MQWQGLKIHVVAVSVIVALAFFLGANWLYNSLNFREPLKKELSANEMVYDYRIEDDRDGVYLVYVTIRETENLQSAYRQVYDSVEEVMGNRQFAIQLMDRRNELLNNVYNEGQFAIQEALVQGNFQEMAVTLHESARQAGAESRVFIDDSNIYWQIHHGEHYLHEVIPRSQSPGMVTGELAAGGR